MKPQGVMGATAAAFKKYAWPIYFSPFRLEFQFLVVLPSYTIMLEAGPSPKTQILK